MIQAVLSIHLETNGLPLEGEAVALSASIYICDGAHAFQFARIFGHKEMLQNWDKGAQNAHQITPDDVFTMGVEPLQVQEDLHAWLHWMGDTFPAIRNHVVLVGDVMMLHLRNIHVDALGILYTYNPVTTLHAMSFPELASYSNWCYRHLGIHPDSLEGVETSNGIIYIRNMARRNIQAYFRIVQGLHQIKQYLL